MIRVKAQMSRGDLLSGMHLNKTILQPTDNLSWKLQKQHMSAAEGQGIACLTVMTLERMQSDEAFELFLP